MSTVVAPSVASPIFVRIELIPLPGTTTRYPTLVSGWYSPEDVKIPFVPDKSEYLLESDKRDSNLLMLITLGMNSRLLDIESS